MAGSGSSLGDAGASDVLVPVNEADVARMAQIQALRMMGDSQRRTNETLDRLGDKIDKVGLDVAGLKASDRSEELHAMRASFEAHVTLVREDNRTRDERISTLLAESLDDRKEIWLAIAAANASATKADTERKGEIKNISDRIVPIFSAISAAVAVVVALVLEKVLK